MKFNFFAFCFTALILASCAQSRVATISSQDIKYANNDFTYENDTVKIVYNFIGKNGAMNFTIFNKLNLPIYIDWKKSAFIPNDNMISYWRDETNTTGSSFASYYGFGLAGSSSSAKSIREERIGVVPPKAMITCKKFTLVKPGTKLKIGNYSASDSPFRYRNYLAISTSEQFNDHVTYIDNYMFVSSVIQMKEMKAKKLTTPNTFYVPSF